MLGRRQRREERLYWEGFRDALVTGRPNPGLPEVGPPIAERPRYPQGFQDGKRAAKRIHRGAFVAEVRKLSLEPGDVLAVKCSEPLSEEMVRHIQSQVEQSVPGTKVMILPPDLEPLTIRPSDPQPGA